MSPALAGRFPTTGPLGKSPLSFWKHSLLLASQTRWWSTYPSLPRTLPPLAQKVLHPTKHSVPGKPETCCKLIFLLPHGVLVWAPPRENSETRIRVQVVYFGGRCLLGVLKLMAVVSTEQPPMAGERAQDGQAPWSWPLCDAVGFTASPGLTESESKSALNSPAWALLVSDCSNSV